MYVESQEKHESGSVRYLVFKGATGGSVNYRIRNRDIREDTEVRGVLWEEWIKYCKVVWTHGVDRGREAQ